MAVLSTVIGRGTKGSRPAAGTAGSLYFATDEGILYRDNGSAWEAYSIPGLVYAFSTTTTDADPGAGTLRFNNATPASVTIIYIDDQPHNSDVDMGTVFDALTGARILVQQADDPAKYLLGEVTADTDGTGYWKLTVTVDSSGTLIDDGALCSVMLLGGGGGGGGGGETFEDARLTGAHKQTYHLGCHWLGITTNLGEIGFAASSSGTRTSITTDPNRLCSSYSGSATTLIGWRINDANIQARRNPDLSFDFLLNDFDDGILYFGFYSVSLPPAGSSTLAGEFAGLHNDNGDTNFTFVTRDSGGSETTTDTGVAIDGDWHDVRIYTDDDGVTWYCEIDGSLVATHTTNLPSVSTGLYPMVMMTYNVSSARAMYHSYSRILLGSGGLQG